MSVPLAAPYEPIRLLASRTFALCLVELQKLRRDRTEVVTRAVQPALWLIIFGQTFTRLRVVPTGDVPYLDFLAPGILAQSALFVSIFYGIHIIWERDAGVLAKLMVTPTPRAALVTGKAFAASVRALTQALVVVVLAALLGVSFDLNPLHLLGVAAVLVLGSAGAPERARRAAVVLLVVELGQGLVGFVQYFTNLPVALVTLHLLGAALTSAALTWLLVSVRERPEVPQPL
jgi:ABC-2 type transport system permease protein